jgi:hypothetical protein
MVYIYLKVGSMYAGATGRRQASHTFPFIVSWFNVVYRVNMQQRLQHKLLLQTTFRVVLLVMYGFLPMMEKVANTFFIT